MRIRYFSLIACLAACLAGHAQQRAGSGPLSASDTARRPRPYREVITAEARTQRGLFTVHYLHDRYYWEIPDSLLGRDILVVNRIARSAAGDRNQMLGYAGDEIGSNVIRFERGPSHRLFMKIVSYAERSGDSTGMYQSVLNSNLQPIAAAFDIKAYAGGDTVSGVVIDVTDYLGGDNDIFYFDPAIKGSLSLGAQQNDRSYIGSIHAFPMNIEIHVVKTYLKAAAQGLAIPGLTATPTGNPPLTFELNSSMVLLPAIPMKARYADARVGYFSANYVDFDANPQGIKRLGVITRWRMEPRDEDIEKYKRGELVEPKNPIVYYIDPATPRKWVPYLMEGVDDWQKAFEQAGFKNAIIAREAPADSGWSLEDARHNVIVYKPSDIANASGPNVHDPRSGEIIETHVNWYHNVMELLHDWYMIQAGAVDPRARKMQFDDSLMGQLIRFVSSHEIGHTLGLMHNYGASSTVPVELLRNKAFVEAHGHTPSIMDYARFNYVAQPEDSIGEKGIFPRIGDYDKWAIQWGYKWLPQFAGPADEAGFLNRWIIDSVNHDHRLWFGTEHDYYDPRSQNEDLGDDATLAGAYGIKNLQRILPNLLEWTREPNEGYDNALKMYVALIKQFNLYMGHAAKIIGGSYSTPKAVEEPGPVFETVPYEKQKAAMAFFDKYLFTTPSWLIDESLISRTNLDIVSYIKGAQSGVLHRILGPEIVYKLVKDEAEAGGKKTYTASDLFEDLRKGIWSELYTHAPIDAYRRNLQKEYIACLISLTARNPIIYLTSLGGSFFGMIIPAPAGSDVGSLAREEMVRIREDIRKAMPGASGLTKAHLQDMEAKITEGLNPIESTKQAF